MQTFVATKGGRTQRCSQKEKNMQMLPCFKACEHLYLANSPPHVLCNNHTTSSGALLTLLCPLGP